MGVTHDQAICLRHREWSETSQTVILLTREHGLIRGLAKGSRRERSGFSGGFELLTLGEVGLIVRPSTDLALITEWDLHLPFLALRRHYDAAVLGMFAAEITASSLASGDPHPGVFDALARCLTASCDRPDAALNEVAAYFVALLRDTGQMPDLSSPGAGEHTVLGFDPARGVLIADPGAAPATTDPFDPAARHGSLWRLRRETAEFVERMTDCTPPAEPESIAVARRGVRFLAAWLAYRSGRRPTSLDAFLRVTRV